VEICVEGGIVIRGVCQDLSPGGLFVRTQTLLPVGARVELLLHVVDPALRVFANVVHSLSPEEARTLGRISGVGLAFSDLHGETRNLIESHVSRLKSAQTPPPVSEDRAMTVLVADGETRLLERLSTSLARAGFDVVTAANGVEAYSACLASPPDVIVADLNLPVLDGMKLLMSLGARSELAGIPVLMMSEDGGDLVRLQAYQSGVMDFLPKPFTAMELCIRTRRLALMQHEKARRVVLRGEMSKISLATLLNLFNHEQRSGILAVTSGDDMAWLSLDAGRVVKARALGSGDSSIDTLMRVFAWQEGQFEFTACDIDAIDEVGMSTPQLLLEHARVMDERHRDGA